MVTLVTFNMLFNHLRFMFGKEFQPDVLFREMISEVIKPIFDTDGDCIMCVQELNSFKGYNLQSMIEGPIIKHSGCTSIHRSPKVKGRIWSGGCMTLSNVEYMGEPVCMDLNLSDAFRESGFSHRPTMISETMHLIRDFLVDNYSLSSHVRLSDGGVIGILNVHLVAGSQGWADRLRLKQLGIIHSFLERQHIPYMVMGDFNQSPVRTLEMIQEIGWNKGFVDGLTVVSKKMEGIHTHESCGTIDYCVPDARFFDITDVRILDTGSFFSDHVPVSFIFKSTCMCNPGEQP